MILNNFFIYRPSISSHAINAENPDGRKGHGGTASSVLGIARKGSPCLKDIEPGQTVILADITGTGKINHIWMTVDECTTEADRFVLRDLVLRMYWDGEKNPSVEVPLGDFFCCGFGEVCNFDSEFISVVPARGFNSFFPMPFREHALVTLENQHKNAIPAFFYQIDYELGNEWDDNLMYFHSCWRRQNPTLPKKDYVILDRVSGHGLYIGTFLCFSSLSRYWWGEGEVKFFIDGDVEFPTICGTGMEDYFGGSWSFAKQVDGKTVEQTYATRYLGYPFYSKEDIGIHSQYFNSDCPAMRSFYRWHLPDPIRFRSDIKVTVQQIGLSPAGLFERSDDVSSVAYWYQNEPHQVFMNLPVKEDRWPR